MNNIRDKYELFMTNRIKKYDYFNQYLKSIDDNKCLVINNNNIIELTKDIILKNKIGSDSSFGVVYLTIFKNKYKMATKLLDYENEYNNDNSLELELYKKITEITLKYKIPHFPLIYKTLLCNNNKYINSKKIEFLFNKNSYYMALNELANGDINNILISNYDYYFYLNMLKQLIIVIYLYHKYTGYIHNDLHIRNFLYYNVNIKGYMYYKIYNMDLYVPINNYIYIIWDYGKSKKPTKNKTYIYDFIKFLKSFLRKYSKSTKTKSNELYNKINNILEYINIVMSKMSSSSISSTSFNETFNKEIEYKFINYVISELSYNTNRPDDNLIINKNPIY